MFQLSLSTILTSPTTPGAGLIPALSGDFSAAMAGVVDAAAASGATVAAPGVPRQTDAEPGKSLPIAAQTAPAADTAADEELERVIAAAGEADKLAISHAIPAQTPVTTITAAEPVAVAPATTQAIVVIAGAPASPVSPGTTPQPSTPKPQASQQAGSDTTTIEAPSAPIVIAPSGVVPKKTNPVSAKHSDPKKSADDGDERRDKQPVEGASRPAASVMAIAVAPVMPSPAGDPVPTQTATVRTLDVDATAATDTPKLREAEAALPTINAADVESAPARPDAPTIPANATAPTTTPHAVAANVAAPAAGAVVQPTPPIAAASPALVGNGPAGSPSAHAAPAIPAAAPPAVVPAAAASAASASPRIAPATSSLPAQPVEAASITRLATDGATKPDAPVAPAVSNLAPPAPAAPTPQLAQPAAIAFGVAFGGILPGQRPLGGDRPSPREQALQALTALAGATPAAPIAAASGAQHNMLDMRRDDWPQAMIDRIDALRDAADATSTRITLVPDALGKVDLSIRHDGSTVHVHFAADAAQTRAILADAQPKLAELAQQRGFRLGQATVDAGGSGDGQRQQPQSTTPPPQRPASAFTSLAAEDAAADPTRLA